MYVVMKGDHDILYIFRYKELAKVLCEGRSACIEVPRCKLNYEVDLIICLYLRVCCVCVCVCVVGAQTMSLYLHETRDERNAHIICTYVPANVDIYLQWI